MVFQFSPRVIRYIVVGLLTYAIYAGVGQLLLRAGVRLSILAPTAFTAAIVFNYLMQRVWVFDDRRPLGTTLPKYLIMICVGYVLNSVVLIALVPSIPLSMAQFVSVILVVMSNALFSFLYVFSMK